MKSKVSQQLLNWHKRYKDERLLGRYITIEMIKPILKELKTVFKIVQLGFSFQKRPIYKVSIGSGAIKILIWSQMHGNEATGTKVLFDLIKLSKEKNPCIEQILSKCTLVIIPMLNPDGAEAYTRVNAQGIDLNRDAVTLKAIESRFLHDVLQETKPQFCFNLHDQRTIFSIRDQNLPATLSFLAPSIDKERTLTEGRKITMSVISAMFNTLKSYLPNQIGRYTDEFYPTATGDNFQKFGYHTILIEAGHYKDDYQREKVRGFNFLALLSGLHYIANGITIARHTQYLEIPENKEQYLDIIYKNAVLHEGKEKIDIGMIFKEELTNRTINFGPTIAHKGDLSTFSANTYIDLHGKKVNLADLLKN